MDRHSVLKRVESQNYISSTHPVVNNCLKSVLHLFKQSIGLQNVDDSDKNQESFAVVVSGWDPTLHPDVGDVVLVKGVCLDALHGGGVGHQLCRVWLERPFLFPIRTFSFILVSLGLIKIVDAQEEGVVHDVKALKNATVSLYCRHQCCVSFGIKMETFRDKVKKIKILEGWIFLCPLTFGCLTRLTLVLAIDK